MTESEILAARFEASRARLRAVAYRMLGSRAEADDAVQEAFLRLLGAGAVDNFAGWLTTVVARICLDRLRERKTRNEVPVDAEAEALPAADDPERDRALADSVGVAMLVVLETLTPAERVAFILHDMFDVSFDEIAPVVGRSPAAARQLASRGRRRIQGAPAMAQADRERRGALVAAFLAAASSGDFAALLAVLDPDVVLTADAAAVAASAARASERIPALPAELRGSDAVATLLRGRFQAAEPALVDGEVGLVIAPGGRPALMVDIVQDGGRIIEIAMIADPARLAALG